MNLLKELEPFAEHLKNFKAGYGITDTVAIQNLAVIWDTFAETRKEAIYGSANVEIPKTKLSCASCIKDMMNMLVNWQNIVRNEGNDYVEFKGVPDKRANVKEVTPKVKMSIKEVHEALTAKGIKFHHKTGLPKLLELLNERK